MSRDPNFEKAEREAQRVLEENFIVTPPVPIEDLVQEEGLGLIYTTFDEGNVSGVINLETKYLLVNKLDTPSRQRFTIAHELGHWMMHFEEMMKDKDIAVLYRKPLGRDESDIFEQEANCFAANLLVPSEMLRNAMDKQNQELGEIDEAALAALFQVSRAVIGYRRKFLRG